MPTEDQSPTRLHSLITMNALFFYYYLFGAPQAVRSPSGSSSSMVISGFLENLERDNTQYDIAWTLAGPVFYYGGVYESSALLACGMVLVLFVARLVGANEYHWRGPIFCFFSMQAFSMDEKFDLCGVPSVIAVLMCLMDRPRRAVSEIP